MKAPPKTSHPTTNKTMESAASARNSRRSAQHKAQMATFRVISSRPLDFRTSMDLAAIDTAVPGPRHGDIVEGNLVGGNAWVEVALLTTGALRYLPMVRPLESEGGVEVVLEKRPKVAGHINEPFAKANCLPDLAVHIPWCVSNCGRLDEVFSVT